MTSFEFWPKFWRVSAKRTNEQHVSMANEITLCLYDANFSNMSLWRRDELHKLNSLTVWRSNFRFDDPAIRRSDNPAIRRSRSGNPTIRRSRSDDPAIRRSRSVDLTSIRRSRSDDPIRRSDLNPTIRQSRSDDHDLTTTIRRSDDFLLAVIFCSRRLSARCDFLLAATFCSRRFSASLPARGEFRRVIFKALSSASFPARGNRRIRPSFLQNFLKGTQAFPA